MKNIIKLRKETGAGVLDCKVAYELCNENYEEALVNLINKREGIAKRKSRRKAKEGLITSYVHNRSKIGVLLELNCESEFASQTELIINFAKDLAMHIVSESPEAVVDNDGIIIKTKEEVLLEQVFYKSETIKVEELIFEHIARIGENISIKRFARFQIGDV